MRAQIVGMDAASAPSWREQRELLLSHVRKLREHKSLRHLPLILIVESNLGFEAAHNARYVIESGIDNVEIAHEQKINASGGVVPARTLHEYATNSVGVRTTHQSKERMYLEARRALEDQSLRVWNCGVSSTDFDTQRKKLVQQLHNYSAICSDPTKALFGSVRRIFTGKAMGEQDDLVIAMMIALLYRRLYLQAVNTS